MQQVRSSVAAEQAAAAQAQEAADAKVEIAAQAKIKEAEAKLQEEVSKNIALKEYLKQVDEQLARHADGFVDAVRAGLVG